ncbi:MAG: helix-turn-helix transcriptional regulator [Microbacterium sp.]|nr:helix-turn-helix transcriptional regulator [Microbacterium sp.]
MVTQMETPGEQFNAAVGRQLRGEIAAGGSSIAGMARQIGIARSALDNYVTGKRSIPVPILYAVCAILDIAPHKLVARAEERLLSESEHTATVTPLHRRTDVPGRSDNEAEVAFRSHLSHDSDTDDLYQ